MYMGDKHAHVTCCGKPMLELVPNTTDGATEKHVPVVSVGGGVMTVKVGEVMHPATQEHHIVWIMAQKKDGGEFKYITPGEQPVVTFGGAEEITAVYEYCNLHGLWKTDV
jgi:superoxide reductase